MSYRTYTKEQLIEAVAESQSIRQTLIKLGLVPVGDNYRTVRLAFDEWNINISHFVGKYWSRGIKRKKNYWPIQDYLENKRNISSKSLRLRLIKEGLKTHKCEDCKLTKWKESEIPLELHHIDGNNINNNLSNLQLLCPNCHSFTKYYRGRKPEIFTCPDCKNKKTSNCIRCRSCAAKEKYKEQVSGRPTKETLQNDINSLPYAKIGEKYGVSDKSIVKWAKAYGIYKRKITRKNSP